MYNKVMAAWIVKAETKRRCKGLFLQFLGVFFAYGFFTTGIQSLLAYWLGDSAIRSLSSSLYILLATGPFVAGLTLITLTVIRNHELRFTDLFSGFEYMFKVIGLIIVELFFVFLWTLLFIIPGIIAAYSYSMALYIFLDDPSKGILQCIRESKIMMRGNKFGLFALSLSIQFIWVLLTSIAIVVVMTYAASANNYLAVEAFNEYGNQLNSNWALSFNFNAVPVLTVGEAASVLSAMSNAPMIWNLVFILSGIGLFVSGGYMMLCTATFYDMIIGRISQEEVVEREGNY